MLWWFTAVAIGGGHPQTHTAIGGLGSEMELPIINGEDGTPDEHPEAGVLLFDGLFEPGTPGEHHHNGMWCSSVLIAPDVVLVAAHCISEDSLLGAFEHDEMDELEFRWSRETDVQGLGGDEMTWPDDAVRAKDWVIHSGWSPGQAHLGLDEYDDLGLVFLDEALDLPFAYLIREEEVWQLNIGSPLDVVGWGMRDATGDLPSGVMQHGDSTVARMSVTEMQVGLEVADVRKCHGDSGGPSFMQVETNGPVTQRLVGVCSHIYDLSDCSETGVVDTRVDAYLDWIDQKLRDGCADGTRVWCEETGIPALPVWSEDTGTDSDAGSYEKDSGCGCATSPVPRWPAVIGLLAVIGLARRRTRQS